MALARLSPGLKLGLPVVFSNIFITCIAVFNVRSCTLIKFTILSRTFNIYSSW
jgi:hypothetical protein